VTWHFETKSGSGEKHMSARAVLQCSITDYRASYFVGEKGVRVFSERATEKDKSSSLLNRSSSIQSLQPNLL
jgi:hypothetical protein